VPSLCPLALLDSSRCTLDARYLYHPRYQRIKTRPENRYMVARFEPVLSTPLPNRIARIYQTAPSIVNVGSDFLNPTTTALRQP